MLGDEDNSMPADGGGPSSLPSQEASSPSTSFFGSGQFIVIVGTVKVWTKCEFTSLRLLMCCLPIIISPQKAAFERAPKTMTKSLRSLFWSGQRSGHQMSLKAKLCRCSGRMSTISKKPTHKSGTNRATAPRKSAFDSPINVLSEYSPQIWPNVNGFAYRGQKLPK